MWRFNLLSVDLRTTKGNVTEATHALPFRAVIELWRNSAEFRGEFTKAISDSPFDAFFWETPSVTDSTLDRPFEFVLVEGPSLSRLEPDPNPFQSRFTAAGSAPVLVFPNLGGDAVLVVPTPLVAKNCYTHLARFLRDAPPVQVDAFWFCAGAAMADRISKQPTWLSTAGMGVSWLHLRLDSRPKYYRHEPYRSTG